MSYPSVAVLDIRRQEGSGPDWRRGMERNWAGVRGAHCLGNIRRKEVECSLKQANREHMILSFTAGTCTTGKARVGEGPEASLAAAMEDVQIPFPRMA